MKLNSKLAWGAAWTGLAIVIAVPSADFLTGKQTAPSALITSDTDPVQPVEAVKAVDPVKTASIPLAAPTPGLMPEPRKITLSPVSADGVTTPAATTTPKVTIGTPAATSGTPAVTVAPEVETASLGVSATNPPFPAPLSQRPSAVAAPVVVAPVSVATVEPPVRAPIVDTSVDAPLIIDEDALADRVAVVDPDRPMPPVGIADDPADRQSLDAYLAQRGLLDEGSSSAIVTYSDASDDYDPDGFYLSDGPNQRPDGMSRAQWRRWLLSRGVDPNDLEPF